MTTVMEEQISSIIDDFIDVKDPIKSEQALAKITAFAKAGKDVKGFWPILLKTIGNPQAESNTKKAVYEIIPYCTLSYPSQWRPYASSIAADLSALDPGLQKAVVSALCHIPMEIFVEMEARAPGQICIGIAGTLKPGDSTTSLLRAELTTFSRILFDEALLKMPALLSNSWKYITARVLDMSVCFTEAIALTSALFALVAGVDPMPFICACQRAGPSEPLEWPLREESVSFVPERRVDLASALIPVAEGVARALLPHADKLVKHASGLPDSEKWTSICTITGLMGMPGVAKEKVLGFVQGTLLMWLRKDSQALVYMAASSILTLAAKFPAEGTMWRVPAAISLINLRGTGKGTNKNVFKAIAAEIPLLEGKFAPPVVSPLVQLVCDFQDQDARLRSLMTIFSNGLEKGNAPLAQPGALQSLFEQSAMSLVWNTPSKIASEVLVALVSVTRNIIQTHGDVAATVLNITKSCLEWGAKSYLYAVAYWAYFADELITHLEKEPTSAPYKSVYDMLLNDIQKALLYVNDTAIFAQLIWLLISHLSSEDINSETIYDHILSSLKITLLKEKEVGKANSRGIRRFKADKNVVVDQLDSALVSLRLLASRVPSRAGQLCEFLTKYAENILIISQEMHDKVNSATEQIEAPSGFKKTGDEISSPLAVAFSVDTYGAREDDKLIISLARAQKSTSTAYAFRQQSFYQTLSGTNDPLVFKMSHKCNPAMRRIGLFVEASNPMATEMDGGIVHLSTSTNVSPCTEANSARPQQLLDSIHPLEPHNFCELSFNLSLTEFGIVEVAPRVSVAIQHPLHKTGSSSSSADKAAAKSQQSQQQQQQKGAMQRKSTSMKIQSPTLQGAPTKSKDEVSAHDHWPDLYMQSYVIGAIEFVKPFVMTKVLFSTLVWPRLKFRSTYRVTIGEKTSSAQVLEMMEKANFHNVFKTATSAAYSFLSWFDDVFCVMLGWPENTGSSDGTEVVLDMELRSSGAKALWELDIGMEDFVSTIFGGNTCVSKV